MPRYYYPGARDTTEGRKKLSVYWLKKHNYLSGNYSAGGIKWSINGEETGSIQFAIDTDSQFIRLSYKSRIQGEEDWRDMDYQFELDKVSCYFRGFRWFFKCYHCKRRCAIIYTSNYHFVCRKCANLSYESCNENKTYRSGIYKILNKTWKADEYYQSKIKREFYNGKPTKKYLKYIKMNQYSDREVLKAELSLSKSL